MYEFPNPRPSDDAGFTTPDKGTFVEARCIAVRLGQSLRGERPDQVECALEVEDGQEGVLNGQTRPSDVGGEVALWTGSLNGEAPAITFKALRMMGMDAEHLLHAYAEDPEALAIRKQVLEGGGTVEDADDEVVMLAINRGDVEALGLGRKRCRLVVMLDEFGGKSRVRVKYVNAVPEQATSSDLAKLLSPGIRAAIRGAAPPKPQPLAPPARGNGAAPPLPSADKIEF